MKKCEQPWILGLGVLAIFAATPAFGQQPSDGGTLAPAQLELEAPTVSGQVPPTTTPPLLPAEVLTESPTAVPSSAEPSALELRPPQGAFPSPELRPPPAPGEEPGRAARVGMSLLLGSGAGAIAAVAGGLVGVAGIRDEAVRPVGSLWTGASLGFALGAPLGVMLAGWLFDGDGAWWATILGDLAGLAAGAGAALLGGSEGVPLLFAFPLAGAVLGYETSSSPSRSQPTVTPVARLGPSGGSLGLAGRF
jgi:hypothetical protein